MDMHAHETVHLCIESTKHTFLVFVPDMKLHHSRTVRQQSSQNHQTLHWRAAVIQTEKGHVKVDKLMLFMNA